MKAILRDGPSYKPNGYHLVEVLDQDSVPGFFVVRYKNGILGRGHQDDLKLFWTHTVEGRPVPDREPPKPVEIPNLAVPTEPCSPS